MAGKKPSSEWFFSSPGWRRHCPSAAGRVPLSPPNKKVQSFWAFCLFWVCYARNILQNDFTRNFTRDFTLNFTLSRRRPYLSQPLSLTSFDSSPAGEPCGAVQTRCTVPYPSRSDRFNGVTGSPGGLRGEIEISPGPLAKKGYNVALGSMFVLTPSENSLTANFQLPLRGSLLGSI